MAWEVWITECKTGACSVKKNFDRSAAHYDQHSFIQDKSSELLFNKLITRFPNIYTKLNFLEIGCGTGHFAKKVLIRYPKCHYTVNDQSSSMLLMAQKRLATFSNVDYLLGNAESLGFKGPYDVIVSNMALHWFKNFETSINKLWSSCKQSMLFAMPILGTFDQWYDFLYAYDIYYRFHFLSYDQLEHIVKLMSDLHYQMEFVHYDLGEMRVLDFLGYLHSLGIHSSDRLVDIRPIIPHLSEKIHVRYDIVFCTIWR